MWSRNANATSSFVFVVKLIQERLTYLQELMLNMCAAKNLKPKIIIVSPRFRSLRLSLHSYDCSQYLSRGGRVTQDSPTVWPLISGRPPHLRPTSVWRSAGGAQGETRGSHWSISSFREECCKVELAHAAFDHSRARSDRGGYDRNAESWLELGTELRVSSLSCVIRCYGHSKFILINMQEGFLYCFFCHLCCFCCPRTMLVLSH